MTDHRDFNDLLQRLDHRISFLVRRWSFDPDVRSEAVLSLWRHYLGGVVDEREMCRRMDADVRCYVRREVTQRVIPDRMRSLADVHEAEADLDRLIARADAIRFVALLDVPDRARAWVDRAMLDASTPVAAAARMAGHRWFKRVRTRFPGAGIDAA
jgi:hypothetical protein